ncbi:MAG: DNA recombination protein RmuC [Rhizobiaceae bacterium]|nr:DNA recombination protein RmuC [Rhizobiaceae bacterium]
MDFGAVLEQTVMQFGNRPISVGEIAAVVAGLILVLIIWRMIATWQNAKRRAANEAAAIERAREAEARMAELVASQNELTGRMQTMSEIFSTRQGDMMRSVNERLESMGGRIGQSITQTTKNTQESLSKLQERLAVIDNAQNNIVALSSQVVELQHILSNKQTRGAFGEGRMQAIVQDGLPKGAYQFQATLSNSCRPDCLIFMPNDTPSLVIDAKFPLEAWNAIRSAKEPELMKVAATQFRRDVEVHIKAISEKYLIAGETQDTAFMFVPSESVFAEIHENFEALVQKALRARVIIVSPSLLMLSIQVIQSVLKDTRMREQAHLIQGEIIRLMEDVSRMDERVRKLDTHFRQAQKDVEMILTSSDKVNKRGTRIVDLDFEETKNIEVEKVKLKAVE